MPTLRKAFMKEFNNTTLQGMIKKRVLGLVRGVFAFSGYVYGTKKGEGLRYELWRRHERAVGCDWSVDFLLLPEHQPRRAIREAIFRRVVVF